jgi:hypothetical protein
MNLEMASIDQVQVSVLAEGENIEQSQLGREQLEVEYAEVESRKEMLTGILKGIDSLITTWVKESKEFVVQRSQLIGDCLLFAFCLVFCGALDSAGRTVTLGQAGSILDEVGLKSTGEDAMDDLKERLVLGNQDKQSGESGAAGPDAQLVRPAVRCYSLIESMTSILTLSSSPFSRLNSAEKVDRRIPQFVNPWFVSRQRCHRQEYTHSDQRQ